jgi:hypothetical protein
MRFTILAATLFVVVFAACGGAAAPTAGVDEPQPAPATADTGTPSAPAPAAESELPSTTKSAAPPASASTGSGSGNGGFASRPCDLVSQADAETAAGVGGLSSSVLTIDQTSGICSWRDAANQVEVYAGIWEMEAAEAQWSAMKYLADSGADDVERVDGLGGDAIYGTSGSVLLVYRNGTLAQLTIRSPGLDDATNKANLLELGKAVLAGL